jgi:hypothetical protein
MSVTETVYKGKIRSWGKTKKSLAVIHLTDSLAADLADWQTQCSDPSPDAIFANEAGGFLGHGQLSEAGAPQTRQGSGTAEADVSSDL